MCRMWDGWGERIFRITSMGKLLPLELKLSQPYQQSGMKNSVLLQVHRLDLIKWELWPTSHRTGVQACTTWSTSKFGTSLYALQQFRFRTMMLYTFPQSLMNKQTFLNICSTPEGHMVKVSSWNLGRSMILQLFFSGNSWKLCFID